MPYRWRGGEGGGEGGVRWCQRNGGSDSERKEKVQCWDKGEMRDIWKR